MRAIYIADGTDYSRNGRIQIVHTTSKPYLHCITKKSKAVIPIPLEVTRRPIPLFIYLPSNKGGPVHSCAPLGPGVCLLRFIFALYGRNTAATGALPQGDQGIPGHRRPATGR